jgi:hypothetical protein
MHVCGIWDRCGNGVEGWKYHAVCRRAHLMEVIGLVFVLYMEIPAQ